MLEIVVAGGWMMVPILLCSALAMGIVAERFWTLRPHKLAPQDLLSQVQVWLERGELDAGRLRAVRDNSQLGVILAAALANRHAGRDVMKERIEESASKVVHDLARFLNPLGTIAAITPLLGLLGTVIGMIDVFSAIMIHGTGDAARLAGGISQALITTAAGLTVAIPAIVFHRFFLRRVDEITVTMEQAAAHLLEHVSNEERAGQPQSAKPRRKPNASQPPRPKAPSSSQDASAGT